MGSTSKSESWSHITEFFTDFAARDGWSFTGLVLPLVDSIRETKRSQVFRAGQSLWRLIISMKDSHGLEVEDSFISVDPQRDGITVKIEFWANQIIKTATAQTICSGPALTETIEPFLLELWLVARTNEHYPKR